jgi:hypothetical protein
MMLSGKVALVTGGGAGNRRASRRGLRCRAQPSPFADVIDGGASARAIVDGAGGAIAAGSTSATMRALPISSPA